MTDIQADRRSVLGAGAMLVGAVAAAAPARAQGTEPAAVGWRPTFEPSDAWMDKSGTRHRIAFDATNADAASAGLGFALNYIHTSQTGYGTTPKQLGVIVIMRHLATPFAFNDRIWAKYGRKFASMLKLEGGEAIRAAKENPLLTKSPDASPPPKGLEWIADSDITSLAARGVQFAVCGLATEGIAMELAGRDKDSKPVFGDLSANLVIAAHLMPSGIVAVGHAQEHGYAIAYVGPEPS